MESSGAKLNATTVKETLSKLTSKNELQNDESDSTPLLYTVISEASGDVGEAHMPGIASTSKKKHKFQIILQNKMQCFVTTRSQQNAMELLLR